MAVGTPTKIGSASLGSNTSSLTATLTAGCNSGDLIIAAIQHDGADTITLSMGDSRSNTYQQDAYSAASGGSLTHCALLSATAATALQTSDLVSISFSTSSTAVSSLIVYKVSGMVTSSWLDKAISTGVQGSGTTPSSGATAATTQADELVMGAMAHDTTSTTTAGSGYTLLDEMAPSATRKLATEYKIVAATGAQTATYTLSGSSSARTICATYKALLTTNRPNLMTLGVG